jgi:hypothetical protein
VVRVDRELNDIPLRDPDVLEQAPGRERLARRLRSPERGRPVGDRLLEPNVRISALEQRHEVLAQRALWVRRFP